MAQKEVFDFQHESLALVLFVFGDMPEFKSKLANQLICFRKLFLERGDVILIYSAPCRGAERAFAGQR